VWFCSNAGGALGRSGLDANNQVAKISLQDVQDALLSGASEINVTHSKVKPALLSVLLSPVLILYLICRSTCLKWCK